MLRTAVLLAGLVLAAFAPSVAAAQDEALEPSATGLVEIGVGENRLVRIPVSEEMVVVEATQVEVAQVAPDALRVTATGSGRAVVMLRGPTGFTSLVIRTIRPEVGPPVVTSAPVGRPGAPDIALGGDYQFLGTAGAVIGPDMLHWASFSEQGPRLGSTAFASVRRLVTGEWGLQDIHVGLTTRTWAAEVGDVDETILRPIEGLGGAYATMRGVRGHVDLGHSGFSVGAVGGVGRRLGCCSLFEPDELVLGAATVGWLGEHASADVLGGVMWVDGQGPQPLARLRAGYHTSTATLTGEVVQSGPGTGGAATFQVQATDQIEVHAAAQGRTANFVRPQGVPGQGGQIGGIAGISYAPGDAIVLSADLLARERGGVVDVFEGGGRFHVDWRPLRPLTLGAAYQRTLYVADGQTAGGDTVSLNASFSQKKWYAAASGYIDLQPPSHDSLYAGAEVGWMPTHALTLDAGYRTTAFNNEGESRRLDQAWLGLQARTSAVDAMLTVSANLPGAGQATPSGTVSSSVAWSVRRFLQVGVGGYVSAPFTFDSAQWSATAFWTLRPTALGRDSGGLGLRGRVTGVVFLDLNRNGEQDDNEKGLPDMKVTVDDNVTATTDAEGRFEVPGLPAGAHQVVLDRQAMHSIGSTRRTVMVGGAHEEVVFPLVWGGRIQGLLYDDLHGDGTFDNGDPGVRCESVMLRNAQGVVVETTFADGGRFTFSGLAEGEYTVMVDAFEIPEGYTPIDDLEPTVFVEEGKALNVNIRLHANRAIGGVVWEDVDRDGEGAGKKDLGIGGAEVYLSTGEVARTGPDGSFLFRDLGPGAYAVRTELGTEAKVVVLPTEPKEILDLSFVLPKGTKPPEQNVTVSPKAPDSVAGLTLEAPMSVLPQGVALQVTATAVLSNGETREVTSRANWSSSDTETLSVSADGKVIGRQAGTAGVTAEWKGGVGDPLTFEVLGSPLDRITLSPVGLRLNPGNTADLRVHVVDRSGRGGDVTPVAVWQVADTKVARIDATGRLKALKDGVTTVRAQIGDTWSAPLEIQVITAEVTALSIENLPARMPEGATVQLRATGYDTRLEIQNVTESVTWASSDPAVLQVEPDGRVISVGRGTAQITASIGSLFTRSRTVFVTNTPPLKLEVVPPGMSVSVYDLGRFRATATFEDGSKGAVTTVVEWIVTGDAAIVRADGTVVPKEPGRVTVRARYLGVESEPVEVTVTE